MSRFQDRFDLRLLFQHLPASPEALKVWMEQRWERKELINPQHKAKLPRENLPEFRNLGGGWA